MFFIILTFAAALFIECLGSLVSVIGISALFGANPIIIALAIALDLGKVVTVSLLYTYWKALSKLMKGYALLAAVVTMIITSAGAAGYLSGEFQKAIMGTKEGEVKVAVLKEQQLKYQTRKQQIDDQIAALPERTTVNQRLRLMNGFKAEQKVLDEKITQIDKDLPDLQVKQIGTEAKAGPIIAIAKSFNVSVEEAVKWVIALIISVFDPLAIFLIISGNFLWAKYKAGKVAAAQVVEPQVVEPIVEAPVQPATIRVPEAPAVQFPMSDEFPTGAKIGDAFFHTLLRQMFFYNGTDWEQANTLSAVKEELTPEQLKKINDEIRQKRIPEDLSFPPMRNARRDETSPVRTEASDKLDMERFFTPPTPPVETTYTTFEPSPAPIIVPEPKVTPEIENNPEDVFEEPTLIDPPVEEDFVENDRRANSKATYVQTGLLKPVEVHAHDDQQDLDLPSFTPLTIPEPAPAIEVGPVNDDEVKTHREEITRSSLGLVPADPSTIVDAQRHSGYRKSTAIVNSQ